MILRLGNRDQEEVRRKLRLNGVDVTGGFTATQESVFLDTYVAKVSGTKSTVRSTEPLRVRDNVVLVAIDPPELNVQADYSGTLFPGYNGPLEATVTHLPAGTAVRFSASTPV